MKDKDEVFLEVAGELQDHGFTIINKDDNRPWGGFYVIDETNSAQFVKHYFPEEDINELMITEKISPKILLVAPHSRLSWQYHFRRAEIWRCLKGPVAVATSDTNEEKDQHILQVNDIIRLKQGQRHRLIGLENWGIMAEIWQHTNIDDPSNEEDIVRIQDDFGR